MVLVSFPKDVLFRFFVPFLGERRSALGSVLSLVSALREYLFARKQIPLPLCLLSVYEKTQIL